MKSTTSRWVWLLVITTLIAGGRVSAQTLARCGEGCSSRSLGCGDSSSGELAEGDCLCGG